MAAHHVTLEQAQEFYVSTHGGAHPPQAVTITPTATYVPYVCPLCNVAHTTSVCPRANAAPQPFLGNTFTYETCEACSGWHARGFPCPTALPLRDADVNRIARRCVELMFEAWEKEASQPPAFVGTVDELVAHINALDHIDEHGIRHDEGEG